MKEKQEYLFKISIASHGNGFYDVIWDGTDSVPESMITESVDMNKGIENATLDAIPEILTYIIEVAEYAVHQALDFNSTYDLSGKREDIFIKPNARSKRAKSYFHDKLVARIRDEILLHVRISNVVDSSEESIKNYIISVSFDKERRLASGIDVDSAVTIHDLRTHQRCSWLDDD